MDINYNRTDLKVSFLLYGDIKLDKVKWCECFLLSGNMIEVNENFARKRKLMLLESILDLLYIKLSAET